jgi:hypothetical protein
LGDTIGELRGREREALAQVHERLAGQDLDLLVAMLDGLRGMVCEPLRAMPVDRARELLRAGAAALLERCA